MVKRRASEWGQRGAEEGCYRRLQKGIKGKEKERWLREFKGGQRKGLKVR